MLFLFDIQIVIVYHRPLSVFANGFLYLFRITIDFSYAYLIPSEIHDAYDVIFFKFSFDTGDSNRKYADRFLWV